MGLETNRLFLRAIRPEDWESLKSIAADFRTSEYVIYDRPLPVEEREIMALTKQFAQSGLFFGVFLKESPVMIGYVCFHNENEDYDLGYCFHSSCHDKGYALESCLALMADLRQNRSVKRFTAGTALKNKPSCKLLRKLGFQLVGTEQLSFSRDEEGKEIVFEGGTFVKYLDGAGSGGQERKTVCGAGTNER